MPTTDKSPNRNLLFAVMAILLSSCNDVWHDFRNLDDTCWRQSDTLLFSCDRPFSCAGEYMAQVEMRCTPQYPYKDIWIEIKGENATQGLLFTDTLHCEIYDEKGHMNGSTAGVLYQMSFPLPHPVTLPNDSVNIILRHIMSDDSLPGVSDVGIRFSNFGRRQSLEN